uniref:carbohydrate porin n=1 Tax=uncultured Sphingomonas sp. TaxID=158754 RepID=UPI0035CC5978
MIRTRAGACGLLMAAAAAAPAARAQETAVTPAGTVGTPIAAPAPRDTLTGDWGGLRTDLKDAGIGVRADYVSESFAALDGGARQGTSYVQQIRGGIDFDMGTLVGWSGAILHVTLNDRRGIGLSSDFTGNRLPIQEAAGGEYAKLTELSYEQTLAHGRLDLRLGFFAMGNDLGGMALGCTFVNAAFCAHPLSDSGNSGWYNYPNVRWGAAVRYRLRSDLALRAGVYQVNPNLSTERNAFKPFAGGTTGVLLPLELEYDPGLAPRARALPGHYKLGFYYDTSRAARKGAAGTLRGRYGVYILADQTIWRDGRAGRGVAIFGQFTANPSNSAQITRWYAGGFVKTGTFAGRDADTIALGFAYAQVNPRLRFAEAALVAGGYAALPAGETALELSYALQLRRWFSVRPDVQYILDPGAFAYRATGNALALGSQIKVQF